MEIKDYQVESDRTLNKALTYEQGVSNMIFGANGELGEITDILKKHFYQGHELNVEHLKEELGDVMYYIVNLASMFNLEMGDILSYNVDKLAKRYPNGFDKYYSINRNEGAK